MSEQNVTIPAAELARLRGIEKVYAAAVEEIKQWEAWNKQRTAAGGDYFPADARNKASGEHDKLRAEAGMEKI